MVSIIIPHYFLRCTFFKNFKTELCFIWNLAVIQSVIVKAIYYCYCTSFWWNSFVSKHCPLVWHIAIKRYAINIFKTLTWLMFLCTDHMQQQQQHRDHKRKGQCRKSAINDHNPSTCFPAMFLTLAEMRLCTLTLTAIVCISVSFLLFSGVSLRSKNSRELLTDKKMLLSCPGRLSYNYAAGGKFLTAKPTEW